YLALVQILALAPFAFAQDKPLFEIGKADRSGAEFALAPAAHRDFTFDGLFVVGASDAKRDWPYAHPGPADDWGGSRQHTFKIVFHLSNQQQGGCKLVLDLVDTQHAAPPALRIKINDQPFERKLPPGTGDESINGQAEKGKPSTCSVEFPASLLRNGDNEISITTIS